MKNTILFLLTFLILINNSQTVAQSRSANSRLIYQEQMDGTVKAEEVPYRVPGTSNQLLTTVVQAPPYNATSSNPRGPNGNTRYLIVTSFYSASELAAAGFLNGGEFSSIGFVYDPNSLSQSLVDSASIKVYLQNSSDVAANATTNWATVTGAATLTYDGPITLPATTTGTATPVDITLASPFTYTGGSVYLLFEYTNPTASLSLATPTWQCNSTASPAGLTTRFAQSLTTLPTTLGTTSTFRPSIRWGYDGPSVPELEVLGLYSYGFTSRLHSANPITAIVRNNGSVNAVYTATLTVKDSASGAVKFTNNTAFAGVNITGGEVDTLVFSNWNPTVNSSDSISISIAVTNGTDPNLFNNSAFTKQVVTDNTVSHKQNIATTLGVGSNTTSADISVRMNSNGLKVVNQISSLFASTGQTVTFGIWQANANGTPGTRIWTSDNQTTSNGVLTVSVPNVQVNGTFFVGATQTGTVNYGIGYQAETNLRPNTFYFAGPTGSAFAGLNAPFRISIDAQLADIPSTPIADLSPTTNNFGTVAVGYSSSARVFTIKNTGAGTLSVTGVALSGTDVSQFTLTNGNTLPASLLSNQSLSVSVTFSPSSNGPKSANLSVTHSLGSSTAVLSGVGFTPNEVLIAYDSTSANGRVSRDSVLAYLTRSGLTSDLFNKGANTSTTSTSFTGYKYVIILGEASSTLSLNTKESLKTYLANGSVADVAKAAIFSEDLGYDMDRVASTAPSKDTTFARQTLGFTFLADRPVSGGNQRLVNIGTTLVDSTVGTWPDVFGQSSVGGTTPIYRFVSIPTGDSLSALGRSTATFRSVVAGFDIRSLRTPFGSTGSPIDRVLDATFYFLNTGISLPVEWGSFNATMQNGAALLRWTTLTETNNSGFTVERSNNDQLNFKSIGFVSGSGTTTESKSYSFMDKGNFAGVVYYRLKQTDFDGNTSYNSVVVEVNSKAPSKFALGQNYPNPFNPTTTISYQIATSTLVSLKVYDILGREVATLVNTKQDAGSYNASLNAVQLSSGIYFYKLQAGNFVETRKMMLIK